MKSNRFIWGLTVILVLITIAVSFAPISSFSQKETKKEQVNNGFEDLSKYPIVDYNAPLPLSAVEREERILKNKRYDNQHWVLKNPHPEDSGVGRVDEVPSPPVIPTFESDLIIVGEIINANAYLSNDKTGVYSEYIVKVENVIKGDDSNKAISESFIIADRSGGCVRYPKGQKVYYQKLGEVLPWVGSRYVLFFISDKQSPNYIILTGYELKGGKAVPLDDAPPFRDLPEISESNFIEAIRDKISSASKPVKN